MVPKDNDIPRPDPDVLLKQVQTQEKHETRGKLRIYFGAAAGVGKTYAMLVAAYKLRNEGFPILVGTVDTHGRSETERLLAGLKVLPLKTINYKGKQIKEFDIDAALVEKPRLILVDELAHTNAPGSRHPKRWQDVEELLDAGIDVFTTLNVQHLDTLNDVISGITGVRVAEIVPDTLFNDADDVVLVDIPPDELLARFKAGKIYRGQQAEQAVNNFFRKGNLIALRQLALRRTTERVGKEVQAYRVEQSIEMPWKISPVLLVCIGPSLQSEHVVRSSARLAGQINVGWHTIYVETPELQRLPAGQQEGVLKILKLAESLGAKTAVLSGNNIPEVIVKYARKHNFAKIVFGRSSSHNRFWRRSCLQLVAAAAPDLDLIEIGRAASLQKSAIAQRAKKASLISGEKVVSLLQNKGRLLKFFGAALASLLTTGLAITLVGFLSLTNLAMLFLLTVVLIGLWFGRSAAVVAACVGAAAFDFFLVPPQFTFASSDLEYLLMFIVMLALGLITGNLAEDLAYLTRISSRRESQAQALDELARDLSTVLQVEPIFDISANFIQRIFHAKAILLLPDANDHLQLPLSFEKRKMPELELGIAQWAFKHAEPAGIGTDTLPTSNFFYLPLVAPMRTRGLLAILPESRQWILIPEQKKQLETFAALLALTLERVHYVQVAQDALVCMESEHLRNSLLSSLSRDLRAPLASLLHLSKALVKLNSSSSPESRVVTQKLRKEMLQLHAVIANLLEMERIQSREFKLNRQWHSFRTIVDKALEKCQEKTKEHQVQTQIPEELPAIYVDSALIERVIGDLIENAAKYTPAGTQIALAAELSEEFLRVNVYDNGPGLPSGKEEFIFEKFTRGEHALTKPGVGLGLAICRGILHAHGGSIHAGYSPAGGASIIFSIPIKVAETQTT